MSRHIRNVFSEAELPADSNMQKVHIAGSDKPDNALVAMTLMTAESRPKEREVITAMLTNLIAGG